MYSRAGEQGQGTDSCPEIIQKSSVTIVRFLFTDTSILFLFILLFNISVSSQSFSSRLSRA